jgi:hypothetical protein
MRNTPYTGNALLSRAIERLRERLPVGWRITGAVQEQKGADNRPDAFLEIRSPDGRRAKVAVETKQNVTGADAAALAPRLTAAADASNAVQGLVVTRYLSPMARERLGATGVSYLDLTGNIRLSLNRPGLFIETRGAERDPSPRRRDSQSLKGGSAARIVRALCDWRPPVGVRELSRRAQADPGYVSRVLRLLEKEDVITREERGRVTAVRWKDLLRRWAQDYAVTRTNESFAHLDPRGVENFVDRLRVYPGRWALTGSRAVPRLASTAPPRLVSCYLDDPARAAADLGIRTVETGANVLLIQPFDSVIWERARKEAGLTLVAVSQCAVDLLTGTGREPSQAEAVFDWMERNESDWRA